MTKYMLTATEGESLGETAPLSVRTRGYPVWVSVSGESPLPGEAAHYPTWGENIQVGLVHGQRWKTHQVGPAGTRGAGNLEEHSSGSMG